MPQRETPLAMSQSCIGGEIRNVTVSRAGGHWYVAIQVEKAQMRHLNAAMSINQFVHFEQAYHQANPSLAYSGQMQAIR